MKGATIGSDTGQITSRIFNKGKTNITYTLTDASGNYRNASFVITLSDTIKPDLICPADTTIAASVTRCYKFITLPAPSYSDNCKVRSLVWTLTGATALASPAYGIRIVGTKSFNGGSTLVTYIATDSSGNTNSCTTHVTVTTTNHCGSSIAARSAMAEEEIKANTFSAALSPNPTVGSFILKLQSTTKEAIDITVYSADGRKVQEWKSSSLENVAFGGNYQKGVYHIEVRQGNNRATVTGVKQ